MGFQRRLVPENVLGGTKCAMCGKIGGCIINDHLAGELNCELELADKQSVILSR